MMLPNTNNLLKFEKKTVQRAKHESEKLLEIFL